VFVEAKRLAPSRVFNRPEFSGCHDFQAKKKLDVSVQNLKVMQ